METTVLALMLGLVFPSLAMDCQHFSPIPLCMMHQSVDDMYDGCENAMAKIVKTKYFPSEINMNALFREGWNKAINCANNKYRTRPNKALTIDQIRALCVYTAEKPKVYDPFNKAMQCNAARYTSNAFKYHALHFWLTSAIKTINPNRKCRITYRRNNVKFIGKKFQRIRFGSFASTSMRPDLVRFGTETCFYITTCYGASIQNYSDHAGEAEVLVPPYEKFQIIHIASGSYKGLSRCKNIFVLKSVGRESNLNCKVPDMETTMLALMLCLVLPTFAVDFPFALTMMDQSVDDKYDGCREKMTKKRTNQVQFGRETCFQITTCFGAPIQDYSAFNSEKEVLVPPYEKFRIARITRSSYGALYNCKNIIVLESAGYKSNLNCMAAEHKKGWKAAIKRKYNSVKRKIKNFFTGR
ncbi:hypothetical protein WMY93_014878 [Mugilogobius chulae]|uniref:NAD(P)(+)--arginine ADP-ribosyltransferase n=1 Tax=Mugilogobius chulae TaxID=88201 RepID=A0AAW0NWL4_9GOBI